LKPVDEDLDAGVVDIGNGVVVFTATSQHTTTTCTEKWINNGRPGKFLNQWLVDGVDCIRWGPHPTKKRKVLGFWEKVFDSFVKI